MSVPREWKLEAMVKKKMSRGERLGGEDLCDSLEMGAIWKGECSRTGHETGGLGLEERREW